MKPTKTKIMATVTTIFGLATALATENPKAGRDDQGIIPREK